MENTSNEESPLEAFKKQYSYLQILIDFKKIPLHKRTRTFMEICGYPHYENVCSNILKFYLDPSMEHGLKGLVLNALIECAVNASPLDDDAKKKKIEILLDYDPKKVEIFREHETNNNNRLDILFKTDKFVMGIENKIFHHLRNDLADYHQTVNGYCHNSKESICIVLSLSKLSGEDSDKMKDNKFQNVTYEQLFRNIKQEIGNYLIASNVKFVNHLTDFIITMENLISETMENLMLRPFFDNNFDTIEELIVEFNKFKESFIQKASKLDTEMRRKNYPIPNQKPNGVIDNILVYTYQL